MGVEALLTFLLTLCFPFSTGLRFRLVFAFILLNLCTERYRGKSLLVWDELKRIFLFFGSYMLTTLFLIPFREFDLHYFAQILLFNILDFILVMLVTRYLHLILWNKVKKNVLIVGAGTTARQVAAVCRLNRYSLMDIQGFVNCNNDPFFENVHQKLVKQKKPVYKLKNLEKTITDKKIDTVIIAIPEMTRKDLNHLTTRLAPFVETIKFMPQIESLVTFDSQIDDFDGLLMISSTKGHLDLADRFVKRTIDIAAGIAGCLVLIPLTGYVWVLNRKNGDTGPLFFTQKRIGKDGVEFEMTKFRTMLLGADEMLEKMMEEDPAVREEYEINKKLVNDPRITPAGQFLREKSFDEFPQFLQVLSGKMSLVGPRPYLPREKKDMEGYYDEIIQLKPGVTGMWQTHGRSNTTFEERMELDSYYYRNWNLWLDMVLLVKTFKPWITGKDKGAR